MATQSSGSVGRARAEALAQAYAASQGRYDIAFDESGDMPLGEYGFRHDADKDALIARVFVAKAWLSDDPPERQDAYRKVARALNDPAVGGMFEQGGGHFRLDEGKRLYFLERSFPLSAVEPSDFVPAMHELRRIGRAWTLSWFARVANVAHGRALPPARPVTRQDDPDTY